MQKLCCVNDCPIVSEDKELYSLPCHYRLKQSWLANIRDKINGHSVELNGNIVLICHLHFKPAGDFSFIFNDDGTMSKHLEQNAVPSVFPQNPAEWNVNLTAHKELDEVSRGPANASDHLTIPNESAVQLGNVESLGIIIDEEQTSASSEKSTQPAPLSTQEDPARSPDITRKTFLPRLGNSPSLPSRLQYSCANCDFKTTDAIILRSHRVKQHTKKRSGQSVESASTSVECSSSAHKKEFKEDLASLGQSLISIYDGHRDSKKAQNSTDSTYVENEIEHLCMSCSFVTTNLRKLIEHQRTHDLEGSSTEELSEGSDNENREKDGKGKNNENACTSVCNETYSESAEPGKISTENKMCEEMDYVYCCPICEFWARSVTIFHSHLVVTHNKSGTYKCSRCDFTSISRRSITKHVSQMQDIDGGHDNAVWVIMLAAAENLDYSHYLKPASLSKAVDYEKQTFLDARVLNGSHHETTSREIDYSPSAKEVKQSASFFGNDGKIFKYLSNSADDHSAKVKRDVIAAGNADKHTSHPAETNSQSRIEECDSTVEKNIPLRKLLRLCRIKKGSASTILKRKKAAQRRLEELLETQKRGASDQRAIVENEKTINERVSALRKEKIRIEFEIRKHQCDILRRRITLCKVPGECEAHFVEQTQMAIAEVEMKCQQLEPGLKTAQLEIQELELKQKSWAEQLKEITDSNAGVEQLISITKSEVDDDERRLSELRKESAALQERLRKAVAQERGRIKIATTVQRAQAACDYKERLQLLQDRERKRLRYLDKLLDDGNF